jgi:hypothetical protein
VPKVEQHFSYKEEATEPKEKAYMKEAKSSTEVELIHYMLTSKPIYKEHTHQEVHIH